MYFYCYYSVFLLYVYVWLTWLRFFRAFSSLVWQMPGQNPQRQGTARTLPNFCFVICIFCVVLSIFVLFYYCLFCVVLCIVCVYMCTVLLPPGGYPIAVKYIIYYVFNIVARKMYSIVWNCLLHWLSFIGCVGSSWQLHSLCKNIRLVLIAGCQLLPFEAAL